MTKKIFFVFLVLSFSFSESLLAQNFISSSLNSQNSQYSKNSDSSKSPSQNRSEENIFDFYNSFDSSRSFFSDSGDWGGNMFLSKMSLIHQIFQLQFRKQCQILIILLQPVMFTA